MGGGRYKKYDFLQNGLVEDRNKIFVVGVVLVCLTNYFMAND